MMADLIQPAPQAPPSFADALNALTKGVTDVTNAYYGTRANIAVLKAQAKAAGGITQAQLDAERRAYEHRNSLDTSSLLLYGGLGLGALLIVQAVGGRRR